MDSRADYDRTEWLINDAKRVTLEGFVNELSTYIDDLNGISGKLGYTKDYEEGYKDAGMAIKNTANTLCKKFLNK